MRVLNLMCLNLGCFGCQPNVSEFRLFWRSINVVQTQPLNSRLNALIAFKMQTLETTDSTLNLTVCDNSLTFSQPTVLPAEAFLRLPDFKTCQELEYPFLEKVPQKDTGNHTLLIFFLFFISLLDRASVLPQFSLAGCWSCPQLYSQCTSTGSLPA